MTPDLHSNLSALRLTWMRDNLDAELTDAVTRERSHSALIERLVEGEVADKHSRSTERRLRAAKLPFRATLADFDFTWPATINTALVRSLFTLDFMRNHANAVFIGTVGLGKTHLAAALCQAACEQRKHARFITAAELINELEAARAGGYLGKALKRYHRVQLLAIDELGYLPVDKRGAELLFQVLSGRYERASTVITTNRAYKDWTATFANDAAMTAAVLDRVVHHCHTVRITGKSRRQHQVLEQDV